MEMKTKISALAAMLCAAVCAAEYRSVLIVLPEKPTVSDEFAAKELKYHLEKATGRMLRIVPESREDEGRGRFYIGNVKALAKAGIDYAAFKPEERLVKGVGDDVFLAGGEIPGFDDRLRNIKYVRTYGYAGGGTLYAVYDFLENEMGVKWLWPGELGEVIPEKAIPPMDGVERRGVEPLVKRSLRGSFEGSRRVSIANRMYGWRKPVNARADDERRRLWLTRNRVGSRRDFMFGHAFTNWYKRFKDKPGLFAMQPSGLRGHFAGMSQDDERNKYYPLCVSNPEVHDIIVGAWARSNRKRIADGLRPNYINCCENDSAAFCACPRCREWDAKDPLFAKSPYWSGAVKDVPIKDRFITCKIVWEGDGEHAKGHNPPSLTDRYVRFYNTVLAKARAIHPQAEVCAYAYVNYREPPREVRVSDGVVISYVPEIAFPYTAEKSSGFRKVWADWNRMGAVQMFYRPNYMFSGGNMPYSSAKRMTEDMNFAYARGMIAIDQDSLTGVWSSQALKNYAAARILRAPSTTYGTMLEEFTSAFGAGADEIRRYCGMLEDLNDRFSAEEWQEIGKRNRTVRGGPGGTGFTFTLAIADLYTEEWFAAADAVLAAAEAKTSGVERARVAFLRKGLKDGLLTYRTRVAEKSGDKAAFETAFKTMLDYRASVEADGICSWAWHTDMEQAHAGWPHKVGKYYLVK